jgi:AraC-like DNA-binding protein
MMEGDLGVTMAPGHLPSGYLKGLKGLIQELGGDSRHILERHDVDPVAFDDPNYQVHIPAVIRMLGYCRDELDEPLFGLMLAERQDADAYGCPVALARAAPNMRLALQSLVDYVPVTVPDCELELLAGRNTVELRWYCHADDDANEQGNYQAVFMIIKALHMLGRQLFRPSYASISASIRPADSDRFEKYLGCRVTGNSSANAVAFSSDMLEQPTATFDSTVFSLLKSYLAQQLATSTLCFVQRVEVAVRNTLLAGDCSANACAARLGTSVRTLQKRLTRTDSTFSNIVQSERTKLAKRALRSQDL